MSLSSLAMNERNPIPSHGDGFEHEASSNSRVLAAATVLEPER